MIIINIIIIIIIIIYIIMFGLLDWICFCIINKRIEFSKMIKSKLLIYLWNKHYHQKPYVLF